MARPLARRHAQAIFRIALEGGELDRWRADLARIAEVLANPQLRPVWENPRVRLQNKLALVGQALEGVSPLALNLAGLLLARGRVALVLELVEEYGRLVDAHRGIAHAQVTTAIPLDEGFQEGLAQRLSQALGQTVALSVKVDPAILGGMVARIGDRLIDGSLKSRLEDLRQSLAGR